jgi:hypothetical protein
MSIIPWFIAAYAGACLAAYLGNRLLMYIPDPTRAIHAPLIDRDFNKPVSRQQIPIRRRFLGKAPLAHPRLTIRPVPACVVVRTSGAKAAGENVIVSD